MHSPPSSWEGGTRGLTIRLIGRGVCVCGVCVVCVWCGGVRVHVCVRQQGGGVDHRVLAAGGSRASRRAVVHRLGSCEPAPGRCRCRCRCDTRGLVRGILLSTFVRERATCMRLGRARGGSVWGSGGSPNRKSHFYICESLRWT